MNVFREQICESISLNFEKLEEIWAEVGYSENEKEAQVQKLKAKMVGALEAHTEHQSGLRHQMREQIRKTEAEIVDYRGRLGDTSSDANSTIAEEKEQAGSGTLVARLGALMRSAEQVRAAVEVRGATLERLRAQLAACHAQLGTDLEVEFIDTRKDLSAARVAQAKARLQQLAKDLMERRAAVVPEAAALRSLLLELGGHSDPQGEDDLSQAILAWAPPPVLSGKEGERERDSPPKHSGATTGKGGNRPTQRRSGSSNSSRGGSRKRSRDGDEGPGLSAPPTPPPAARVGSEAFGKDASENVEHEKEDALDAAKEAVGGGDEAEEDRFPFDVSPAGLARLRAKAAALAAERDRRRAYLGEREAEIRALWDRLEIPAAERAEFEERVAAAGPPLAARALELAEHELASLRLLRREMTGALVAELRAELRALWLESRQGNGGEAAEAAAGPAAEAGPAAALAAAAVEEAEAEEVAALGVPGLDLGKDPDECGDADLAAHEAAVARAQERLAGLRPLLRLIAAREALVAERAELGEIRKDGARLGSRDPRARLRRQRELAMEQRVRRLPKVTEALRRRLAAWAAEHGGEPFRAADGRPLAAALEEEEARWAAALEARKREKKREEGGGGKAGARGGKRAAGGGASLGSSR